MFDTLKSGDFRFAALPRRMVRIVPNRRALGGDAFPRPPFFPLLMWDLPIWCDRAVFCPHIAKSRNWLPVIESALLELAHSGSACGAPRRATLDQSWEGASGPQTARPP